MRVLADFIRRILFVGWCDFSNFGQFQEHLFSKINGFIVEIQVTDQGKSIFFV